jgi:hypothetical protein
MLEWFVKAFRYEIVREIAGKKKRERFGTQVDRSDSKTTPKLSLPSFTYRLNLPPGGDAPPLGILSGFGCFDPTIEADEWPAFERA